MVQFNLNFTHACRHTCVLARLIREKLQKLMHTCTVASDFGVRMQDSECTQHTRDARHKLALGLPHYMYDVAAAVGNEIQLRCS